MTCDEWKASDPAAEELGPYYGICCYPGDRHEQRDPDPACECECHATPDPGLGTPLPVGALVRITESWAPGGEYVVYRAVLDQSCRGDTQWWSYDLGGYALVPGWQLEDTGKRVPVRKLHCAEHGHVFWQTTPEYEPAGCPKDGCTNIVTPATPEDDER